MGVHLIETSSGLCSENIHDRMAIYHKLLEAQEENQERLARTVPGMKAFLLHGNWLGVSPFGYTTYGPRTTEFSRKKEKQEILINEAGQVLKKAWQWKLQGERDSIIIDRMDEHGVRITKQRLSDIWRNPFYCGVIINSLLDEPVHGNWTPMITQNEFLKVQKLLQPSVTPLCNGHHGHPDRPLSRFLICEKCGNRLTGYEVKKKRTHYYKCNVCDGVNMNAKTTVKAFQKGVNDSFLELLSSIELEKKFTDPLKAQLKKMFRFFNSEAHEAILMQQKMKVELQGRLTKLEDKYIDDRIEEDVYHRHKQKLSEDILKNSQSLAVLESKLSNHEEFVDEVLLVVENISKYWHSGDIATKERIQNVVFPNGLVINPENRTYLTKNINTIFRLTDCISEGTEIDIKKQTSENAGLSYQVAGAGLEPTTFGL
jgi:site-specific DNA recombinase